MRNHSKLDLGLSIFDAIREPGRIYSCAEISVFASCSPTRIRQIEHQALRKLKDKLDYEKNVEIKDIILNSIRPERGRSNGKRAPRLLIPSDGGTPRGEGYDNR